MITNERQYLNTRAEAEKFERAIEEAKRAGPQPRVDAPLHAAMLEGMESELRGTASAGAPIRAFEGRQSQDAQGVADLRAARRPHRGADRSQLDTKGSCLAARGRRAAGAALRERTLRPDQPGSAGPDRRCPRGADGGRGEAACGSRAARERRHREGQGGRRTPRPLRSDDAEGARSASDEQGGSQRPHQASGLREDRAEVGKEGRLGLALGMLPEAIHRHAALRALVVAARQLVRGCR